MYFLVSNVYYFVIIKEKADIFICPYENYDEVIELKNKNNYNINIIKVSSFSEAIEKLSNIN